MFARTAGERRFTNSVADTMGQVSERWWAQERREIALQNHVGAVALPWCLRTHALTPAAAFCLHKILRPEERRWLGARWETRPALPVPGAHEPAPGQADRQLCNLALAGANEHRYRQDLFFLLEHIRLQISSCSALTESRYRQLTLLCQPAAIPLGKTLMQQQHPALQPVSGSSGISVPCFKHTKPGARGTLTCKLLLFFYYSLGKEKETSIRQGFPFLENSKAGVSGPNPRKLCKIPSF